jgi:hypothetical protein
MVASHYALRSCSIMGGQGLRPARRRWLTACLWLT